MKGTKKDGKKASAKDIAKEGYELNFSKSSVIVGILCLIQSVGMNSRRKFKSRKMLTDYALNAENPFQKLQF